MQADTLEGLNPAQREAVETIEGPLLIIAGPGSGKTRVITHRIAYLVRVCGVGPHRIAAVTFTNKAAREMRERLDRLLGTRSEGLTCGTFHALCVAILRRDGHHIGLDRDFTIYDQDDQLNLLKRGMAEANIDPRRYPIRAIHSAISGAKSTLLDPAGYADTVNSYYEEIVLRVYEGYQGLLAQSKALDFDDLLLKAVQLLQRTPEALQQYQARYLHLLIDEFQDTNIVQYTLSKLLAGRYRNICVVGDPDQSIYSWRNADIRNILSFQKDYPDAKVVSLVENYRSTQIIVEAAKHLISPNRERLEKDLWTRKQQGVPVEVREAHNEEEEAQWVV
ncbi:MAG: UvrD-helicase domain-containing protein, partial [Chloroflexi bacterium]|nr:UvrD-helicase domain-containing protein [Chloroflexota bacterium]